MSAAPVYPRLTPGEALFIDQRRRGMTQQGYAELHGVTVAQLHKWQNDIVPKNRDGEIIPIPKVKIIWGDLKSHERCVIARRRSGQSRATVAATVGVSPQWLSAMERGTEDPGRLVEHWKITAAA